MRNNSSNKDLIVPEFKELIVYSPIIFLLYLYLFQPPIIISKYYYIGFEFIFFLVYVIFINKKLVSSFVNRFPKESFLLLCIVFYSLIRELFANEIVYFDRFSSWAFQSFLFGFVIIDWLNQHNRNKNEKTNLFSLFYWTAFVASLLSFFLFTSSTFDSYYTSSVVVEDFEAYAHYEKRHRLYGIAENLSFTFSYVLGFFAGYTILVIKNNYLLIIPFVLFLLGVILNARIGFFAVLIFLIYQLIISKDYRSFSSFFMIFLLLIVSYLTFFDGYLTLFLTNKDWVVEFFYEISDMLLGTNYLQTNETTIATLMGRFIIWPETFSQWIFGSGKSLFFDSKTNTDVGYILQLNYGGLILITLIFSLLVVMIYRLKFYLRLKHWFFFVFLCSVLILNFKGFLFAATPGGRLFFLLYIFFINQRIVSKSEIDKR
ncbi:membrane protein [Bacteroidia bacterium]|nr:membrane protein [Bacteroidia bacterium]